MRRNFACPDTQPPRGVGEMLPIEGTLEEFPECPAAYLRGAQDLGYLSDRFGKEPFAPHLIEGSVHPYSIVGEVMSEIENGARNVDTVSAKVMALVHLGFREQSRKRAHESAMRKAK